MLKNIFVATLSLIAIALCLALGIHTSAYSQSTTSDYSQALLSADKAVVTGFSKTLKNHSAHNSINIIDLNGVVVKIINLPSSQSFGVIPITETFTLKAKEVGQVFGVAIDDHAAPNIYVTATSVYGLAIYKHNKGRIQKGSSGAKFVEGMFGPAEKGGGPTSIWKIDGSSGQVSLFANVSYQGIENTPASLGGIAFDPASKQLFVVNRATGMIHRFSLDGSDHGTYDHGVDGLTQAGKKSIPFAASDIVTVQNNHFDTKDPTTWGLPPLERRTFAVSVYNNRLYYSAAANEIWSVGIAADGSFDHDAKLEAQTTSSESGSEISSINFDQAGNMYIAQRGAPTGDALFEEVAKTNNSVIRFSKNTHMESEEYAIGMLSDYKNANGGVDINCENMLLATGDHLFNLPNHQNTSSSEKYISGLQGTHSDLVRPQNVPPEKSIFINYYEGSANNYNTQGFLGSIAIFKSCKETHTPLVQSVPSTEIPPAAQPSTQPPIGLVCPPGTNLVDGMCLHPPIHPPMCAECCLWNCLWGPWSFACPGWIDPWWGNPWGGLWWEEPWGCGPWGCGPWGWGDGFWGDMWGGAWGCGPWGCGAWPGAGGCGPWGCGAWPGAGGCGPWGCGAWPGAWDMGPWGWPDCGFCHPIHCNCLTGICGIPLCLFEGDFLGGPCIDLFAWCPGEIFGGHCFHHWPFDVVVIHDKVKKKPPMPPSITPPVDSTPPSITPPVDSTPPNVTPPGDVTPPSDVTPPTEDTTPPVSPIDCKANERLIKGKCVPMPDVTCPPYTRLVRGRCVPDRICKPNERLIHGRCVPVISCKPNERLIHGRCVPVISCKPNERLIHGRCVPVITCKQNEILIHGICVPIRHCKPYERFVNGKCVPNIICKPYERLIQGKCVPITQCKPYERLINGKCVPATQCKPYERLINGRCVPVTIPPRNVTTPLPSVTTPSRNVTTPPHNVTTPSRTWPNPAIGGEIKTSPNR